MKRYGSLRASDADRETVIDRLRDAAGEGRLEPDELEQRVGAALRGRTYGELAWLVADLPQGPGAPGSRSRARPIVRSALVASGLAVAAAVAVALVALVVLAAAALAAAWWVAGLVFWLVCCGPRRHLARSHRYGARRVRRARPAGLL